MHCNTMLTFLARRCCLYIHMYAQHCFLNIQLEARRAAIAVLAARRDTARNFGNAGEVNNLLNTAKTRQAERKAAVIKQAASAADAHAARMDNELVSFTSLLLSAYSGAATMYR
jgi:AAA lid domain